MYGCAMAAANTTLLLSACQIIRQPWSISPGKSIRKSIIFKRAPVIGNNSKVKDFQEVYQESEKEYPMELTSWSPNLAVHTD